MRRLLLLLLLLLPACVDDVDGDGAPVGEDCDDGDRTVHPGAEELCNGIDDDCTEGVAPEEMDRDGDGVRPCDGDCDDTDRRASPGAPEVCDGRDNNCDGAIDEGFLDTDGNGQLDCAEADADGDGVRPWQGDCDDENAAVHPGAPELCNGLDDDCDGYSNYDALLEGDSDGDGHPTCDDCDDNAPANFPGNEEGCDGLDNDCDGEVDEGMQTSWFPDGDGDGHGAPTAPVLACVGPDGTAASADDCDDDDATTFPGAPEVCDGADNDCDGAIDEGVLLATYPDADGDGFGTAADVAWACTPAPGWSLHQTDCNDVLPEVHPGAPELCDRRDDDCDGVLPLVEQDLDVDGQTPCEGDCDDAVPTTLAGAPERCNDVDDDCDGQADNAPQDELCPPGFGVDEAVCAPGPPATCELAACADGFWAFDSDYANGCECEDDDGAPDCGGAFDLGSLAPGDSFQHVGRLPDPSADDWFRVQFPATGRPGGGTPSIELISNPGRDYVLDLQPDCSAAPFGCGDTGDVSVDLEAWSMVDDVSDPLGFTANAEAWPETVVFRVVRESATLYCDEYVLEVRR
jgi:hypothetical protein